MESDLLFPPNTRWGRRAEALTTSQEAVDLRRELADLNRDAYLPHHATSLWTFASVRYILETEQVEAMAAARQAETILMGLAAVEPDAFEDNLSVIRQLLRELDE